MEKLLKYVVCIIMFVLFIETALAQTFVMKPRIEPPKISNKTKSNFTTGWYMPYDMSDIKPGKHEEVKDAYASSFSWVSAGVTPPKDQGNTGTCWIFASVGDMESKVKIRETPSSDPDYSEQDVGNYYPSDNFSSGGNCFMVSSFYKHYGTVKESDEPWAASHKSWDSSNPKVKNVVNWVFMGDVHSRSGSPYSGDVMTIKQALMNGPVATSMSVSTIMQYDFSFGTPYYSHNPNNCVPYYDVGNPAYYNDHAVLIVGWDDYKVHTGTSEMGAWLVKNSWGTSWGYNGYFWIAYGSAGIGYCSSYFPQQWGYGDYASAGEILTYACGYDGSQWGFSDDREQYQLVRFTPSFSGQRSLIGVDIVAPYPYMNYTVYIYDNFDGSTLSSLLATQEGYFIDAGSYLVGLTTPLTLTSGNEIIVVVRLDSGYSGYCYIITSEMSWSSHQTSKCYVSDSGANGSWIACNTISFPGYSGQDLMIQMRMVNSAPPSTPSGLTATDGTYTDKVGLTWSAASLATWYEIWRGTSSSSSLASLIGTSTTTSYDDTSAVVETVYYYWVKAANSYGVSSFSSSNSGYRLASSAPSVPTGVLASDGSYSDKVRISWNACLEIRSYEVWRNTSDSTGSATKVASPTSNSYEDTSASSGKTYYYWVKAVNSKGTSSFSSSNSGFRLGVRLVGSYTSLTNMYGVYVVGNLAYTTDRDKGLQIFDVSNSANPTLLGSYDTPNYSFGVSVIGTTAYLIDNKEGLKVLDVSNPASPTLLGSYNTPGSALWLYASGTTVYIADYDSGLQIIDVSTPANPALLGSYNTVGYAYCVYVANNIAYVADGDSGLQIIDVSNPSAPALLGTYNTAGSARGVYFSGNKVYVADKDSGLQIIDVTNPASPSLLGTYNTSGSAYCVQVEGNLAYVADYSSGLQIIDVTNPSTPTLFSSYDTSGSAYVLYVVNGLVYLADYSGGLLILCYGLGEPPYTFDTNEEGWTTGDYPDYFSVPVYDYSSGSLIIQSSDANTYGFWRGPLDAIPYVSNSIYKAAFTVRGSAAQENAPAFRYHLDTQSATVFGVVVVESWLGGVESPGWDQKNYVVYFDPMDQSGYQGNEVTDDLFVGFDMMSFDSSDDIYGAYFIDNVSIERFDASSITATTVKTYGSPGGFGTWHFGSYPEYFNSPNSVSGTGYIGEFANNDNLNTYGYWESSRTANEVDIQPNKVYRAKFTVASGSTQETCPQMRLRIGTESNKMTACYVVNSNLDGINSPTGTGKEYSVYFYPPQSDVGADPTVNGLIFAMDLLNFDPTDDSNGGLVLYKVEVQTIDAASIP